MSFYRLLNNRLTLFLIGFGALLLIGCHGDSVTAPSSVAVKPTVTISINTKAFYTNTEFRFAAHLAQPADIPVICIWDFGDSTGRQYSQNIDEVVHYYERVGSYRASVLVISASASDTIGEASANLIISENVNDSLVSIVQAMKRVTINFLSDKKYASSQNYSGIEKDRQNFLYSTSMVFCGLTGESNYNSSNSSYPYNESTSKGNSFLRWKGGSILDTLYMGAEHTEGEASTGGQTYNTRYSTFYFKAMRIPLLLVTKDSIIFELSGDILQRYCEMYENYNHKNLDGFGDPEGTYVLQEIDWESTDIIPKLRIVLTK